MIVQRRTSSHLLLAALVAWAVTHFLLIFTPLPWWVLLLALILVNAYAYWVLVGVITTVSGAVTALKYEDGRWSVLIDQQWLEASLTDVALFRDQFIMVGLRRGWRYTRLYFWRDSADAMALRKLRMCLKHGF